MSVFTVRLKYLQMLSSQIICKISEIICKASEDAL